ncbi:unnamed protein product [Linum trigynum]|uniref:Uncharacterized protein n=1 Tax=Linum trigynum TaxID=586398 RepID=A0AAV2CJC3_9ROSI
MQSAAQICHRRRQRLATSLGFGPRLSLELVLLVESEIDGAKRRFSQIQLDQRRLRDILEGPISVGVVREWSAQVKLSMVGETETITTTLLGETDGNIPWPWGSHLEKIMSSAMWRSGDGEEELRRRMLG